MVEKLQLLGLAKEISRLSHIAQMNISERKKKDRSKTQLLPK